mmetsp:Transcript_54173/g.150720  ORF Transcript_54173/g.150720 Transcript_54173/m.150720 type:complete len:207 (+) Transcript_54173:493-1113(+)
MRTRLRRLGVACVHCVALGSTGLVVASVNDLAKGASSRTSKVMLRARRGERMADNLTTPDSASTSRSGSRSAFTPGPTSALEPWVAPQESNSQTTRRRRSICLSFALHSLLSMRSSACTSVSPAASPASMDASSPNASTSGGARKPSVLSRARRTSASTSKRKRLSTSQFFNWALPDSTMSCAYSPWPAPSIPPVGSPSSALESPS